MKIKISIFLFVAALACSQSHAQNLNHMPTITTSEYETYTESGQQKLDSNKIIGTWVKIIGDSKYPSKIAFHSSGQASVGEAQCSWSVHEKNPFIKNGRFTVDCPGKEILNIDISGSRVNVDFGFDFEKAERHPWCEGDIPSKYEIPSIREPSARCELSLHLRKESNSLRKLITYEREGVTKIKPETRVAW